MMGTLPNNLPGTQVTEITGEQIVYFLQSISLAEDLTIDGVVYPWGGELNRRLAFEIAEAFGKDQSAALLRFAQLVNKFANS